MNSLPHARFISNSIRFQHLAVALSIFYLLYTLTTLYSASLYELAPAQFYNLSTPFDETIPFISVMIVPYSWSLLLFAASFFLVRTPTQLVMLTRRLILATLFACLVFYSYPARFSFNRTMPDDWSQIGYQFLQITDSPFNQLPSLHVSYAILLGISLWNALDSKKIESKNINSKNINFKKMWLLSGYRLLLVSVCALIIVSTVLTYQHHLLDVLGGIVLAGVVFILANSIRNALVTKHLALGVIGFLLIAIAGFYMDITVGNITFIEHGIVENLSIAIAVYWLGSFGMLAWVYQWPNHARDKRWFQKNSRGKISLSTWFKFAPLLVIYKSMSRLGQWYFKSILRAKVTVPTLYAIHNTVFVVASPRLAQANLENYLTHWLSSASLLTLPTLPTLPAQSPPVTPYQFIVVDLAVEVSSHLDRLKVILQGSTDTLSEFQPNGYCHYLYFPLLDLQPLSDVSPKDYIDLFKQIDALTVAGENEINRADSKHKIKNKPNEVTLINFHCVMGLSRSVGVQVLYLVYCGKLTVDSYRAWIECHYPQAHLAEGYLPKSLVAAIANHQHNRIK